MRERGLGYDWNADVLDGQRHADNAMSAQLCPVAMVAICMKLINVLFGLWITGQAEKVQSHLAGGVIATFQRWAHLL